MGRKAGLSHSHYTPSTSLCVSVLLLIAEPLHTLGLCLEHLSFSFLSLP